MANEEIKKTQARLELNNKTTSAALGVDVDTYGKWARGVQKPPAVAKSHIAVLEFLKENDLLQEWISRKGG